MRITNSESKWLCNGGRTLLTDSQTSAISREGLISVLRPAASAHMDSEALAMPHWGWRRGGETVWKGRKVAEEDALVPAMGSDELKQFRGEHGPLSTICDRHKRSAKSVSQS